MTKTGAQIYPGASKSHWYQGIYGGAAMEVDIVVLHTTEGRTLPDYSGGAVAPTLTAVPDFARQKLVWYQHYEFDVSARALVNLAGGVETNTFNVAQVELVGTCSPDTHKSWGSAPHIYWPQAPDWALKELAHFLAWTHTEHHVPLSGPATWLAYPKSYGSTSARMTDAQWRKFFGICGHSHVPENVHGDPGAIDFAKLVGYAKEYASPAPVAPAKPKVDLSNVIRAFGTYPKNPAVASVKLIQKALTAEKLYTGKIDGVAGPSTRSAYKAWQKHLGYAGAGADGIPGSASLAKLGAAHGFQVTA